MNITTKTREQRISIRFPLDILQGIREAARAHDRSFNGEVVWALRQYLERLRAQREPHLG